MKEENHKSCLLLLLKEELTLAFTLQCPGENFILNNTRYNDIGQGDFYGFYDWLRNPERQIIGVRHGIFDEFNFPFESVRHLPYVRVNPKIGILEVFFSEERSFEEAFSDDQAFDSNKVYISSSGDYALSFYADEILSEFSPEVYQKCQKLDSQLESIT